MDDGGSRVAGGAAVHLGGEPRGMDNAADAAAVAQRGGRRTTLILCLITLYLVWGSSFLFSKIAVNHLPIALFSAMRFLTAGALLALVARIGWKSALPSRIEDWRHVVVAGFFMVFGSNGLNIWAIHYLPSNLSALLNGTAAFWIAGLGVFGRRGHPLSRWALVSLLVGFAGTALMLIPRGALHAEHVLAEVAALVACCSWAIGTLYYRSIETRLSSLMFMALQMCMGGLMLLVVALLNGDVHRWNPDAPGLIAFAYLTLVSSCLAYTAYGWLSLNATPAVIGSYGYVNPAIATFIGWEFLGEHLSGVQIVGMVVIMAAVCLLTFAGSSLSEPKTLKEPETSSL
jgi:drug/metabolite transporter (DMT)-like permease